MKNNMKWNTIEELLRSKNSTISQVMSLLIGQGMKDKKAFQRAENLLYERYNRMPNLRPRRCKIR